MKVLVMSCNLLVGSIHCFQLLDWHSLGKNPIKLVSWRKLSKLQHRKNTGFVSPKHVGRYPGPAVQFTYLPGNKRIPPWSHLGKKKFIFKKCYVSSWEGNPLSQNYSKALQSPPRLSSSGRQFKRFSLWSSRCSNWTQMRPEEAAGPMT